MKIKKTVAVLMSALIVLSSLAVGGITASAATYSTEQLEALCDTYEQRMDGSAYTNMQAAYDAWYDAQAYLVGVEAGIADAEDVDTYYTALETAINNMGTWTAATGNAQASFVDDSTGTSYDNFVHDGFDYTTNILYWPGCTTYSTNNTFENVIIDLYYPTTVLLYDGTNVPTMPVMALASKNEDRTRYVYQLYPAASNGDNSNNVNFRLTESWHGSNGDNSNRTANWTWTMENGTNGYPQAFAGTANTSERLGLSRNTGVFGIFTGGAVAALANGMQFVGTMDSNMYSSVYTLDWYRLTGDGADDTGFISNTNAPIYVVNYKAILDAISGAGLENITSYSYSGATALISAVQTCMNVNPNGYDYASDTAGAVSSCATAIQNAVNAVDAAKASLGTMDVASYMTLASNYADYTATYTAGQGNYTDDSWNAFVSAYDAATTTLSNVANGTVRMTSASSEALVTAYGNLEVQKVTYTYNFADSSSTTVSAPAGTQPEIPANTAATAWASNNNGTHSRTVYSWPSWSADVLEYNEEPSVETNDCSMTVITPPVDPSRTENGSTAVEQCSVCGYTTGGDPIPALGVQITVEGSELGTVTLNDEAVTYGVANKVAYEENYTLAATPSEDAEFVGWSVGGKIISTDATYTTAAYADLTYVPVFAQKTNDFTVTFVDRFNMVLGTVSGADVAALEAMPETYDYLGYTFTGWSMSLEEVQALSENTVVTANYEKDDSITYTVSAPGCVITVDGAEYNDTAEVGFDQGVTVKAADGTATAWTVNGANAAYGAEYTFYVTSDVTVAYTSEEVTAVPTVAAVDVTPTENGRVRFLASRNVPAGYTVVESGFVYGKDYEDAEAALVLENATTGGCYLVKSSNTANDGQFALTFGIASGTGVAYARAYVIAVDAEGNSAVYYADVQSFDYGA